MPRTTLSLSQTKDKGTYEVKNTGKSPALMVRLELRGSDGEQILPVLYSENYFHLMPGETLPVKVHWAGEDTRGQSPVLHISAFNVSETKTPL